MVAVTSPNHATKFYEMVPKGPVSNLLFRREIARRVLAEPEFAGAMRRICAEDPFFYINAMVWTIDPKRPFKRKKVPFVTYDYQDRALDILLDSLDGPFDVQIEKSRQMGASWLLIALIQWCWRFRQGQNFLLGSRSDEYVDKSDEKKSLFWKVDFIHRNLPAWLMPVGWDDRKHRKVKRIINPESHNTIVGEATTKDFGRGGTFTAIMLDEFGSCEVGTEILKATRDATGTRWVNSTPKGTGNAHYRIVQLSRQNPAQVRPLRFHWTEHPIYGRGRYRILKDGSIRRADKKFPLPKDYFEVNEDLITSIKRRGFWGDFPERSPWFDIQCGRATTKAEVAQELEIDYGGAGFQFFESSVIQDLMSLYCSPPKYKGELSFDPDTLVPEGFYKSNSGLLHVWCELFKDSPPIGRAYVMGVDASAGTGASNSVISVWDATSGEKVAEYADPNIRPEALAKFAIAVAKWFCDAYIIWETNGSGRSFGDAVLDHGYGLYYNRGLGPEKAGWAPTRENKHALLAAYRGALTDRLITNRSEQALLETLEFVFLGDKWVDHISLDEVEDPSGARDQHGDRVIADALVAKVINKQPRQEVVVKKEASVYSLAGRRELRKLEEEKTKNKSPYVFN